MTSSPWWFVSSQRCFVFLHFISLAFLYIPSGICWYFGNLSVYLNSYWYARLNSHSFYSPWVLSVFLVCWSGSVFIAGNIIQRIDRRISTLAGVLLFNAGLFTSFLAVQISQTLFIFTFGAIIGIGYGFIQSEALTRMPTLVAKRTGLAFGVLNNYLNIGGIILQWLITQHANPLNMKAANLVLGNFDVFSQNSVIDSVPGIFVVLGIFTSVCHLTGLILTVALKDRGTISNNEKETLKRKSDENDKRHESVSLKKDFEFCNESEANQIPERNQKNISVIIKKQKRNYQTLHSSSKDMERPLGDVSDSQMYPCAATKTPNVTQDIDDGSEDVSQWQMLRTRKFYILWFTIFAYNSVYLVILNFYKIFGQHWIQDDHFLTLVGMAALCVVFLMRILLGLFIDRFGLETTQVLLGSSMSLVLAFYYFIPQIDRWLFAVWTCVVVGLCSTVYVILPVMILKLFGPKDFASKFGIVATATVVLNLIAPPTCNFLLNHFGWSAIFLCTSGLNALALLFNVLGNSFGY